MNKPNDVYIENAGEICEYKGKFYRIDFYNPVDGYRLRSLTHPQVDFPIWANPSKVKIILS